MKKRILFVGTGWSGLVTPIIQEMKAQGHDVDYLDNGFLSSFSYFNRFDRSGQPRTLIVF